MLHQTLVNGGRGLLGSLILFPLAERVEGRDMRGKQRQFAAEMARPFSERRRASWKATIEMVRFAGKMVPYYRDLFARLKFDPESMARDPKYFNDIPFLTKDVIRAESERLLRDDHNHHGKQMAKTGGSTGPSAIIYYDQEAADWSSAVTRHSRTLVGSGPMRAELHFASKFPEQFPWKARMREQVKCLANNRYNIFFSTFEAHELDDIWRQIKSIRPHLIHAHPSTLYQLAIHVETNYGPERAFQIFESSGELLEERQRVAIARVFDCKVVNRYGLAEIGVTAYQTDPRRPELTVFDPFAWPEIISVDGELGLSSVKGADSGELVLTGLKNRMMPLIRYRTGDLATMRESPSGFVIHQMAGRVHDVVKIAGKCLPTHYIQDVLDRVGGVKEFQIEMRGERPAFRIVAEADLDQHVFRDRLASWWGDAVDVEFIDSSALILQGWRSKFRHLVAPTANV